MQATVEKKDIQAALKSVLPIAKKAKKKPRSRAFA